MAVIGRSMMQMHGLGNIPIRILKLAELTVNRPEIRFSCENVHVVRGRSRQRRNPAFPIRTGAIFKLQDRVRSTAAIRAPIGRLW